MLAPKSSLQVRPLHYEVWKYCQSTSKAPAELLQNDIVRYDPV